MHPISLVVLAAWVFEGALEQLLAPWLLRLVRRRVLISYLLAALPTCGVICLLSPEGPHFSMIAELLLALFVAGRVLWFLGATGLLQRAAQDLPSAAVAGTGAAATAYAALLGLFWGDGAAAALGLVALAAVLLALLGRIPAKSVLRLLALAGSLGLLLELGVLAVAPRLIMRSRLLEWGVQLIAGLALCFLVWFNAGLTRRFNTAMLLAALLFLLGFNGIYRTEYGERLRPARFQIERLTMTDCYFDLRLIPVADPACAPECIGFRDRLDVAREPAPGVRRVIWMGGSVAYGFGLDDDETIPVLTEQMLATTGGEWEVLNAGVFGYDSARILAFYARHVRSFNPDYLVLMTGYNDFHLSTAPQSRKSLLRSIKQLTMPGTPFDARRPLLTFQTQAEDLVPDLGFFELWQRMLWDVTAADRPDAADRHKGYLAPQDAFERNLQNLLDLIVADGVPVLLVTEPVRTTLVDCENYALYQQVMARQAELHHAGLLDAAAIFSADPFHERLFQYGDKVHPNLEGNRIIARLTTDWIEQNWAKESP